MNSLCRTIRFLVDANYDGHCYLMRRCLVGEQEANVSRTVEGIVLPDHLVDKGLEPREMPNNWGMILAAGRNCGITCGPKHRRKYRRASRLPRLPRGQLALVQSMEQPEGLLQDPIKVVPHVGLLNDPPGMDPSFVLVEEGRILCDLTPEGE